MRILYVGMKYDYGKSNQGYSFEHYNFYDSLVKMGHEILYFDFLTLLQQHGREWMNRRLLEVVNQDKPDLMFTILFKDELDKKILMKISNNSSTVTCNWFCDDHWRFDNFSKYWAPCFNWVVTTALSALPKYEKIGYENVIKSQWGCNHFLYNRMDLPLSHGVSFIGQPHGNRREVITSIRDAGIDVYTRGNGWESGRVTQDEMIHIFNQSKINLNLSNASVSGKKRITHRILDPMFYGVNNLLRIDNVPIVGQGFYNNTDQIKGRNFEVPGCGGFLLTGYAEDLEQYYRLDKEVVCFKDTKDLIEKSNFYLGHDEERQKIAQAGYMRTINEHTYVHRFNEIFDIMNLPSKRIDPLDTITPGNVLEIQ